MAGLLKPETAGGLKLDVSVAPIGTPWEPPVF